MPQLKKKKSEIGIFGLQVEPMPKLFDDRMLYALYDNQRATEIAADASSLVASSIEDLKSLITDLATELETHREHLVKLTTAVESLTGKIEKE